jgi:RNA polymerase sigma-70 factor (TIGR02943 family)
VNASQLDDKDEGLFEELFDQRGHWHQKQKPTAWLQPEEQLHNSHFWQAFDICLNAMPTKYARFFMMREFLELETHEICENESLTVSHLHVILYRARLRLRECLENGWFAESKPL